MASTLKARSGSTFRAQFAYQQPDGTPVDTTGSTATISFRALQPRGRIILEATESEVDGATLEKIEPGRWRLFLSAAVTKTLPSSVSWELELISDTNSDDVTTLAYGTLLTTPEKVKRVE